MKIAFDFHGTIESYSELFKPIMETFIFAGNGVYIVSGPTYKEIVKGLDRCGYEKFVHYHGIFSVVDYLKQNKCKMHKDEKGTWWAEDEEWWKSKAEICKEHTIDVMIDDSERYAKYFEESPTKFVLFGKK